MLVGQGDAGLVPTFSGPQALGPATHGIKLAGRADHLASGAMDQQGAQVSIAAFGDAAQSWHSAGTVLSRHQTQSSGKLPAVLEVTAVADAGDQRRGCDHPDPQHLRQSTDGFVVPHCALSRRSHSRVR